MKQKVWNPHESAGLVGSLVPVGTQTPVSHFSNESGYNDYSDYAWVSNLRNFSSFQMDGNFLREGLIFWFEVAFKVPLKYPLRYH